MVCRSYDKGNTESSLDGILSITWWLPDTISVRVLNRQNFEPAISGLLGSDGSEKQNMHLNRERFLQLQSALPMSISISEGKATTVKQLRF